MDMFKALEVMRITPEEFERYNSFDLMKRLKALQENSSYDDEELEDAYEVLSVLLINRKKKSKEVKKVKEVLEYPKFVDNAVKGDYEAYFDRKALFNIKGDDLTPERVTSIIDSETGSVVPVILPVKRMPEKSTAICEGPDNKLYLIRLVGIGKC